MMSLLLNFLFNNNDIILINTNLNLKLLELNLRFNLMNK